MNQRQLRAGFLIFVCFTFCGNGYINQIPAYSAPQLISRKVVTCAKTACREIVLMHNNIGIFNIKRVLNPQPVNLSRILVINRNLRND